MAVQELCVGLRFIPADTSDDLLEQALEQAFREAKAEIERGDSQHARDRLFLFAVGLFTFGHVEVAEDIVLNIPRGTARVRRLSLVLMVLLPLPSNLHPLANPKTLANWLRENSPCFVWDQSSLVYRRQDLES